MLAVVGTAAALLAVGPASASVAAAATVMAAPTNAAQARVVVIAVPDLRWSDLASMPRLAAYARTSSVGDLSVRAEPDSARCVDGSLTFAAGNRAQAPGAIGCTITDVERAALRETLRHDRYGADIAALGDALGAAGLRTASVGLGANLLLDDASGRVDVETPDLPAAIDDAEVVAVLDDALYVAPAADRLAAARRLDAELASQLASVPPGATTIVAGTSDAPVGGPHLHALIIHGPGWQHVELTSSIRARVVQLVDLAPTVLATLHLAIPAEMIGRPVFDSARRAPTAAAFVDADRHDLAARRLDGSVRTAFGVAGMVVLVLVLAGWRRRSRLCGHAAVWVSRLAIGLPIATYVLQVVPWWRADLGWYPVMLAGVMIVLAGLTAVVTRWNVAAGVIAVPALIVVVLGVDQLLGGPLQASAPLGNIAVVAGRFRGMGNIEFAYFCASALICAGVVGGQLRERDHGPFGLLVALAIGGAATVIDGAPRWGDDYGGVLAMTPSVVLLLALLAEVRVTAKRVALTAVGVVVVAAALAAADYSRPAADQTHIGRFAGEVLHGGAARTVWRKLYSDLHSFGNVAVTGSVLLLLVVTIVCRAQVGSVLRRVAGVYEAAVSVAVLAVLGTAVNDSGVVIAEFALVTAVLAVVGAGLAESDFSGLPRRRAPLPAPSGRLRTPTGGQPLAS